MEDLEIYPTLYGRAATGKIKVWKIEAQGWGESTSAMITIKHGYIDSSDLQETTRSVKGKNIGKSNETTPFEQAKSEALSMWKKKVDEGYVTDKDQIPKASEVKLFLPMLAQVWEKRSKYITLPAYVQPKLDGIRCLARKEDGKVTMWSRAGKILDVPIEIRESLETVLEEGQVTDGELYVHDWTFQQITSAVKKYRKETQSNPTSKLEYHIYDSPILKKGFHDRFVEGLSSEGWPANLSKVNTVLIESLDEATEHLENALRAGFEGLMVRNYSGTYKYKHRSNDLQKMKKFQDAEYIVVGVEEASGRDKGTAIFVCETESGQRFNVRPMGTLEQRKEYFDNFDSKYYGKMLTVKFQELTDDGIPRFPVGLHFRPDWDMS